MNHLTLSLLGAISSTEIVDDNELEQMLNKLRDNINNHLTPALYSTSYVAKSRWQLAVERVLKDTSTICGLPWLLGRACIGIVVANPNLESRLKCLGNFSINVWKLPIVAPYLLLGDNGSPHIQALSRAGKIVNLAEIDGHPENAQKTLTGEELQTLLELAQDGINPRDVISALLYFTPLTRLKSSYLVFTPDEFGRQGSGKLLAQCDAMIVLGNNADSAWFKLLRDNFTMPVYLLADNAAWADYARNYLQSRYAGRTVEIMSPDLFGSILDKLDGHVERITLKDRLLAEILNVEEDLNRKIGRMKQLSVLLKQDSVLISGGNSTQINDMLEKSQKALRTEMGQMEKHKKSLADAARLALEEADGLEEKLREIAPAKSHDEKLRLHAGVTRPEALWFRIILRALAAGRQELAETYQTKLGSAYPDQGFLSSLYFARNRQRQLTREQIERLRNMPDDPEVLRAKIYFRNALGLTSQECANISALLPYRKDAAEKYYWACYLNEKYQEGKKTGERGFPEFRQVIGAFREAVLAGSPEAGERYAQFCGGERRFTEVQEIADMGNSTGAYIYHLLAITRNDVKLARRYLKMAVALGHAKAVAQWAKDCWNNRLAGKDVGFDFYDGLISGLDVNAVNAGIAVYEFLQKHQDIGRDVPDVSEKLGCFYFCNRQWRKSREVLGEAPRTTEGIFCMAIMKKYGHGGQRDRKKGIELIRLAKEGKGLFALLAKIVWAGWYKEDRDKINGE